MTTVICIPGMFRSGGAMFAHALQEAGVELGEAAALRPPVANFNDDGFYEHQLIGEMQERLLESLGRSWASSAPLPADWQRSSVVAGWQSDMQGLLAWEFAPFATWGWRSPVSSLLLPAWISLAANAGFSLHCLVPLRNPLDVALSLQRTCGMPIKQGLRLWFYYTLAILDSVEELPHQFFSYDAFLDNTEVEIRALLNFIGVTPTDDVCQRVQQVAKRSLRQRPPATLAELRAMAGEEITRLYEFCLAKAERKPLARPACSLAEYRRLANVFDFANNDVAPVWFFSSLLRESEEPVVTKLIPQILDGRFDERYVLPADFTATSMLVFSLPAGPPYRCRIDQVEAAGSPCQFACLSEHEQADGMDLFAPDTALFYGLRGDFSAGMAIRIQGNIGLNSAPIVQFQDN